MNKLLRVAVTVTLLGWIAWKTDWAHVGQAFATLRLGHWLAAVAILACTQLVSARRWQLLAHTLGLEGTFNHLASYYFIGMFFNLVLPTSVGGDVVRAYYLTSNSGKKIPAFLSVLVDRLNGLWVLLVMACVAVTIMYAELPPWIVFSVWGTSLAGWLGIALLPRLARFSKKTQNIANLEEITRDLWRPGLVAHTSLLSLFVQVANVLLVWQVGLALQVDVPPGYYWVLMPMVTVLTLLPVSVNGMGVREGATALLLAPLGVPQATAVTFAFLWFAVHLAVSLLGGLVYLFGRFPKPLEASEAKDDHGSLDRDSHQGRTGQLDQAA